MQQEIGVCFAKLFWNSLLLGLVSALIQLPGVSQPLRDAKNTPLDNIYHENDNLPDDADVFPRIGKIAGNEREQTNCRISPWGRVVIRFSGNSFVHIDRRDGDRNGESWFYNRDGNCWIHDSRIDLL